MTAICGGGTSGPQLGTSAVVLVGSGVIAQILTKTGNPWLEFAAALLTLPELVLSSFCSSDPPAVPTFTAAEAKALLNVTFGPDLVSGLSKFSDLVLNGAWQQYCQCTSGALVVPSPSVPPAGTPIYQAPSPGVATPCHTFSGTHTIPAGPATGSLESALWFPPAGLQPTSLVINGTSVVASGTGPAFQLGYFWADGINGADVMSPTVYPNAGPIHAVIPVNQSYIKDIIGRAYTLSGSAGGTDTLTFTTSYYCNGALPGLVQQSCCPPDTATQSSLDLILKMVTLIQRQIVPFSTVHGAVHAGLSGTGQFAVNGILGLGVTATTIPTRAGTIFGDPNQLFDIGWINVGTADGWGPRQFLSSSPFILAPVAADVTLVGYSIPADVVVTITELVREP